MTVVQIIAGHTVPYSRNNYMLSGFEDGEYYDVPPHVARGMVARGWARLSQPPAEAVQPPPHPEPAKAEDDKARKRK